MREATCRALYLTPSQLVIAMPPIESLAPFMLLALFGSLHCMGMCGGFALASTTGRQQTLHQSIQLSLYLLGKSLSYAILGVSVSLLAHSASHIAGAGTPQLTDLTSIRQLLAWFAGLAVMLCGFASMGVRFPSLRGPMRRVISAIEPIWNSILGLSPLSRSFGIGLSTGLLPCGLSWSALALATQVPPATAGLGLFLFGIGTAPALTTVSIARWIAPIKLRKAGRFLIGPALILLGIMTVARGGLPLIGDEVLPDCCLVTETN